MTRDADVFVGLTHVAVTVVGVALFAATGYLEWRGLDEVTILAIVTFVAVVASAVSLAPRFSHWNAAGRGAVISAAVVGVTYSLGFHAWVIAAGFAILLTISVHSLRRDARALRATAIAARTDGGDAA